MEPITSAREVMSGRAMADPLGSPKVQPTPTSPTYSALGQCEEDRDLRLAFARTTIGVTMRAEGKCKVEESVYGAAIVMPQLARTVGWDKTMASFAIQSWIFLVINIFLQAYLLRMIAKEEVVMDGFAGQMYLCDFGAFMEDCPGPGCTGPLGTQVSGPRLYSWTAITNRQFVKDSLKSAMPDKADHLDKVIDVGEYGIESYWCRLACCFIFMMSCMGELETTYKMFQLLVKIPTKSQPWILPRPKSDETPAVLLGEIEEVQVLIAGMPFFWKLLNLVIVVLPKFMLWKLTTETGITVLMETAGIDDIITNSVGLTFILGIDELIGSALMREETIMFVRACEDFDLYDREISCVGNLAVLSDDEILERYHQTQHGCFAFWDWLNLIPLKLTVSLFGLGLFVTEYYHKHCQENKHDGNRLVSTPMFLPLSADFTWLNAFLPNFFPVERSSEPYWQMPDVSGD